MDLDVLAALAEPTRLRIVELLTAAPRPVGEVAVELGIRQPQATKHLQTLVRAGLVTVHPLGQRRIYALRRAPLRALRADLAGFDADHPDDDVLAVYQAAVDAETAAATTGDQRDRTLTFARRLDAAPAEVWRAWATPEGVRRWWHPDHFTVVDCTVEPHAGGTLRIVLGEGDGARHVAKGRVLAASAPRTMTFELAPLGPGGRPLFHAVHELTLTRRAGGTALRLAITVTRVTRRAAQAVAGLQPGWEQLLDGLAVVVAQR